MTPAHVPLFGLWLALLCWVAAFWIAVWRVLEALL
jgi:hypothetical protein